MKHFRTLALAIAFSLFASFGFSQGPPPPPAGAGHGANGNQTGGNAPIGGGLFVLLGLGVAYGTKKLYDNQKEEPED